MISQHGTLEISRSRLLHNVAVMRARVGVKTQLCATIKADAYGHGLVPMMSLLMEAGVEWVCVYSLEEAMRVSQLQTSFNILVLAPMVFEAGEAAALDCLSGGAIRLNVTDEVSARQLDVVGSKMGFVIPIHVQIDAGLTRVGADPYKAAELIDVVLSLKHLKLEGIFSHLSHGDVPGHKTLEEQLRVLQEVAYPMKRRMPELLVHLQNSGGAWHTAEAGLDLVRVGIALYGLQPSMADQIPGLLPIARVTTPILAIHEREAGTGVGYGHVFVTSRKSKLAVVPVGYADGYPRLMSHRCVAQVRGVDVPVVGRVSMDQIILDVTDADSALVGEVVTVISWDGEKANCLDRMAEVMGTIGYELATHLSAGGGRLRRVVVE